MPFYDREPQLITCTTNFNYTAAVHLRLSEFFSSILTLNFQRKCVSIFRDCTCIKIFSTGIVNLTQIFYSVTSEVLSSDQCCKMTVIFVLRWWHVMWQLREGAYNTGEYKQPLFAMPTTDGGACVTMVTWSGSSSLVFNFACQLCFVRF